MVIGYYANLFSIEAVEYVVNPLKNMIPVYLNVRIIFLSNRIKGRTEHVISSYT